MLTATAWVHLEPVMLLEGNLAASTRVTQWVLWLVGLLLCSRMLPILWEVSASAGVFFCNL